MPRPPKISRAEIVAAALDIIESEGVSGLSLRAIARRLEVVPNAIYYHFPDWSALESVVAAEGLRYLVAAVREAAAGYKEESAVQRAARAYLRFARMHPDVYEITMRLHPSTPELDAAEEEARALGRSLYEWHGGPRAASNANRAMFALLHGLVLIDRGGLIKDQNEPLDSEFAIDMLVAGLAHSRHKTAGA
jgi:AcrR family transcriptional regulator